MQKHQEVETIVCPNCGKEIPLTDVLTKQIEGKIRVDYEARAKQKDEELRAALNARDLEYQKRLETESARIAEGAKKDAQQSLKIEMEAIQSQLAEKNKLLKEAKGREIELARRQQEVEEKERALVLEVEKRVQSEKRKIVESTKSAMDLEVRDLKAELTEKDQKLQAANKNELELRKRTRELEQREKNLELEMHRKLDEERKQIGTEVREKIEDDYRLRLREKEVTIDGMRKQIDELKRRAEQGSVQTQGEAQEVELDDVLRSTFKYDEVTRIVKGKDGADILQELHTNLGKPCGLLLFESKRTKNWNEGWIEKAKQDRLEAKADLVVIVSQVLPKDVNHIALRDGVWVCDLQSAIGLATSLREGLIKLSEAQNALAGKSEKRELVYRYLCSPEFEHRIQAIVDAFSSMREGLEGEKKSMNKIWAQREKEIGKVLENTAGLYGDLKGIIGRSLPEVKALELPAAAEEEEIKTDELPF
ncbi:MAG: DUF2130 domain-containing protein [Ignavibacteriales bacterium]|nr:DUF2130 domain-containing protein [Ignavibacteriales bacterium]